MAGVLARGDCLVSPLIVSEPGRLAPPARLAYVWYPMRNIRVEVLEVFAEAQAIARGITTEKEGNVRAAYLRVKQADNAERWKAVAASKAKKDARNARRRELYKPKTRPPVDHNATKRAYYARVKEKLNADRRAKYDPGARSARHQRTGH